MHTFRSLRVLWKVPKWLRISWAIAMAFCTFWYVFFFFSLIHSSFHPPPPPAIPSGSCPMYIHAMNNLKHALGSRNGIQTMNAEKVRNDISSGSHTTASQFTDELGYSICRSSCQCIAIVWCVREWWTPNTQNNQQIIYGSFSTAAKYSHSWFFCSLIRPSTFTISLVRPSSGKGRKHEMKSEKDEP